MSPRCWTGGRPPTGSVPTPKTSRPSRRPTRRSHHPRSVATNWRIGSASRNSLAMTIAGPEGTSSSVSCQETCARVGHQGAASGTEFDEPHWARAIHGVPDFDGPEPEKFAEHLADLGCRREVAARPERIPGRVIMSEAKAHEALDADRPVMGDHVP